MKHTLRNKLLFLGPTVALGLLSLGLHGYMMDNHIDGRGLLEAGNLPGRLLWVIGIAFGVYLAALLRTIGGNGSYGDNFPQSIPGGGLTLAGSVVLLSALGQMPLDARWKLWLTVAAAAAMAAAGVCRILGRRPWFGFHGVICLFYITVLVSNYQFWSADPQLQEYAYQLLAGVLLMLAAFHRICCDAELLQRKQLLFTGLAAAFCCLAALGDGTMPRFYLASALWALGSVCEPGVLPEDPEPVQETPPEAPEEPAC